VVGLGAGPINLEMATPWLASAIEENIGHGNTVEVGGTQIERAGRIRIAVRIRDIVVRDSDRVVVATAPKAEVKLSGSALLMGRLRAESLNLVDAELAVRISPDGTVTVCWGHGQAGDRRGFESRGWRRHFRVNSYVAAGALRYFAWRDICASASDSGQSGLSPVRLARA
jgi:hypothetical protein